MTPTLVQSNNFDGGFASATSATCTFSSALTPGNLLVIFASAGANTTIALTDNGGNTYTNIVTHYWGNVGYNLCLGWAANTSSSAATVTATYGASNLFRTMVIAEFSGMATATPVDVNSTGKDNPGTTSPTDNAMTTTVAGDLIVSAIGSDGGTVSAGSGYTLIKSNTTSCTGFEYQVQGSAGSITPVWTQGTSVQAIILSAALKAGGGGGGPTLPPPLIMQTRRPY